MFRRLHVNGSRRGGVSVYRTTCVGRLPCLVPNSISGVDMLSASTRTATQIRAYRPVDQSGNALSGGPRGANSTIGSSSNNSDTVSLGGHHPQSYQSYPQQQPHTQHPNLSSAYAPPQGGDSTSAHQHQQEQAPSSGTATEFYGGWTDLSADASPSAASSSVDGSRGGEEHTFGSTSSMNTSGQSPHYNMNSPQSPSHQYSYSTSTVGGGASANRGGGGSFQHQAQRGAGPQFTNQPPRQQQQQYQQQHGAYQQRQQQQQDGTPFQGHQQHAGQHPQRFHSQQMNSQQQHQQRGGQQFNNNRHSVYNNNSNSFNAAANALNNRGASFQQNPTVAIHQQKGHIQGQQPTPNEVAGGEEADVDGEEELEGEEEEDLAVNAKAEMPELKISILDPQNRPVSVQPLKRFEHLYEDVPSWLADGIRRSGYSEPMPVQASSIPLLLEGRDVIAVAPTGSGKTVAFAIPALANLDKKNAVRGKNRASPSVVILCPTRELVTQTHKVLLSLSGNGGPCVQAVFGGTDREAQASFIRRGCEVIVATPGRLCDFLEDDVVSLEQMDFLVLDEADRMLEMGFAPTLSMITSCFNKSRPRVTMMWSATWSDTVSGLAKNFLNPNRLMINCEGDGNKANKNITQCVYAVDDESEKLAKIVSLYSNNVISMDHKAIIFAKRKDDIGELATQVSRALGFPADRVAGLHGSLKQGKRAAIIRRFKEGYIRVLVATDIAGRGLDVPEIDHVINFDLPLHIDAYVHRIGRTGRAGRKGSAHTIICSRDSSAIVAELGEYYSNNEIETPTELNRVFTNAANRSQTRKSRYKDHTKVQGEFWRTRGHDPNAPKPSFNHRGGGGGSNFFTKNNAPRSVVRS